jgi:hypothetical protein
VELTRTTELNARQQRDSFLVLKRKLSFVGYLPYLLHPNKFSKKELMAPTALLIILNGKSYAFMQFLLHIISSPSPPTKIYLWIGPVKFFFGPIKFLSQNISFCKSQQPSGIEGKTQQNDISQSMQQQHEQQRSSSQLSLN